MEQHVGHVKCIDFCVLLVASTSQRDKCRVPVGDEHQIVVRRAGFKIARPAQQTGHSDAAFEGCIFGSSIGRAHFFQHGSVVVCEYDQRIFFESVLVNCCHDAAYRIIKALEHRFANFVFVGVSWWRIQRTMDGVER